MCVCVCVCACVRACVIACLCGCVSVHNYAHHNKRCFYVNMKFEHVTVYGTKELRI